jgi:site-specific DNA-methyltransferase (adenine-specific)|tara:strand:- start:14 stop:496 length:483 start_codon:yes stop_codon:yes gene_type:complete
MKSNIQKKTLSFSCSKSMKCLRTPIKIWDNLKNKYDFTIDLCASDKNHLIERYYTKEIDALKQNWDNEIAYLHPMFDTRIGKFVKKAYETKNSLIVMLLPASTHTRYFHKYIYHNPKCIIEFLEKGKRGFRFLNDDTGEDDITKMGYIKGLMIIEMDNRI